MQKETEEDKEEGWQTVKLKGKKKIGEPNEGEGSRGGNSPPLVQPQHRESLIPVNSDAPLKILHDEILGLAQVLSPQGNQIMDEVEMATLSAITAVLEEDKQPYRD
ncbi:hypothetical protein LOK49_LG15G00884 [Camellia lanceoleosa]|uniref:Uncharacterized protein n=1 Tax=Camellia lanceoleosa TaxID=1840588 RepID=A0ACC0F5I4_9ERIC|nr:hypothetical protein LOK49_LG15G00884 [Camellia lanceoleosa]